MILTAESIFCGNCEKRIEQKETIGEEGYLNRKLRLFLLTLVFLCCLGIMDYPFISRLYNEKVQGAVAVSYDQMSKSLEDIERDQLLEAARAYNAGLAAREPAGLQDAFQDTVTGSTEYEQLLNADEDGVMAVVEIPSIDVSLPVYHGTSEEVLQKGAGHLEGSSLPVGGESTHTCLSAHRGLPDKKLFTNLDLLKEGDIFYIRVLGEMLAYEIYEIETVTPDQTQSLDIQQGQDLATLITCTPYGINTHRLYVHGKRIAYEKETEQQQKQEAIRKNFWSLYWWIPVTILLLLWMAGLLIWQLRSEKTEEGYM